MAGKKRRKKKSRLPQDHSSDRGNRNTIAVMRMLKEHNRRQFMQGLPERIAAYRHQIGQPRR